jgi:hypothetical protein
MAVGFGNGDGKRWSMLPLVQRRLGLHVDSMSERATVHEYVPESHTITAGVKGTKNAYLNRRSAFAFPVNKPW